jgi:hypothetical protein
VVDAWRTGFARADAADQPGEGGCDGSVRQDGRPAGRAHKRAIGADGAAKRRLAVGRGRFTARATA